MTEEQSAVLRKIPSVDALLQSEPLRRRTDVARPLLVEAVREAVAEVRGLIARGCAPAEEAAIRALILESAERRLRQAVGPHYRRAVNATGIILHTGLGRAVLAAAGPAPDRRAPLRLLRPPGGPGDGRPAAAATSGSSGCSSA